MPSICSGEVDAFCVDNEILIEPGEFDLSVGGDRGKRVSGAAFSWILGVPGRCPSWEATEGFLQFSAASQWVFLCTRTLK